VEAHVKERPKGTIKLGNITVTYVANPEDVNLFPGFEKNIRAAVAELEANALEIFERWPKEVADIDLRMSAGSSGISVAVWVRKSSTGKAVTYCSHSVEALELRGDINPYTEVLTNIGLKIPDAYERWLAINKRRRSNFTVIVLK
jgi:hypothetical protein